MKRAVLYRVQQRSARQDGSSGGRRDEFIEPLVWYGIQSLVKRRQPAFVTRLQFGIGTRGVKFGGPIARNIASTHGDERPGLA